MGKKKLAKAALMQERLSTTSMSALFQQGRYVELVGAYRNLIDNAAADPGAAFILAASLFRLGEFTQTLSVLEKISGSLESDGNYQSLCGATCRRLGLLNRAKQHFAAALKLDPNNPDVQNNYANLLIDLGLTSQARQILESLIRLHPHHNDARANLNRLSFTEQSGATPQIVASQQTWQPQDPLLAAFQPGRAGQASPQRPPSQPNNPLPVELPQAQPEQVAFDQIKLVSHALGEKKFELALQLLSSAHSKLSVVNPDIYINAADTYIRLQRFAEAEISLLHALAMGSNTFANYLNLVSLTLMRRDLKLAVYYLNKAAKIDPSNNKLSLLRQQISSIVKQEGTSYQFKPAWSQVQVIKHSS